MLHYIFLFYLSFMSAFNMTSRQQNSNHCLIVCRFLLKFFCVSINKTYKQQSQWYWVIFLIFRIFFSKLNLIKSRRTIIIIKRIFYCYPTIKIIYDSNLYYIDLSDLDSKSNIQVKVNLTLIYKLWMKRSYNRLFFNELN